MSDESDTTMLERTKNFAALHGKRSATIGGISGGVSAATIAMCYQIFTTNSQHKEDIARDWREVKDLEVRVELIQKDVAKPQEHVLMLHNLTPAFQPKP